MRATVDRDERHPMADLCQRLTFLELDPSVAE
jgi:hypothetical protein